MPSKRYLTCLSCGCETTDGYWKIGYGCPNCGYGECRDEYKTVPIEDLPEAKRNGFDAIALEWEGISEDQDRA